MTTTTPENPTNTNSVHNSLKPNHAREFTDQSTKIKDGCTPKSIKSKLVAKEARDDDLGDMRSAGAPTANHSHPHVGQNKMRIVITSRRDVGRDDEARIGDGGQLL